MRKIAVLFFVVIFGCESEAVDPVVVTNDVQEIGQTSVVLKATITETGAVLPIQYGFLWSSTPGLNIFSAANKLDLGSTSSKKEYSIRLDNLTANSTYYFRAFTASPDYSKIYYGGEISFKTLP